MVAPYAAEFGALTLAVHPEHFLMEDSRAGCLLSLHPGWTRAGDGRCFEALAVRGFSCSDHEIEVAWQEREGLALGSTLCEDEQGLRLRLSARNCGEEPLVLSALLPLMFGVDSQGTLALGSESLRSLGAVEAGGTFDVLKLAGELECEHFGAWFTPAGRPSALVAALGPAPSGGALRVCCQAVRGKALSLHVEWPLAPDTILEPGQSLTTPELLIVLGDRDIRESLAEWTAREGCPLAPGTLPDFEPGAEARSPQGPEEEAPLEVELDPEPDPPEEAPPQVALGGVWGSEEPAERPERRETIRRTVFLRRAMRAAEGVWPRWAAGRRYAPMTGLAARSKQRWRREH